MPDLVDHGLTDFLDDLVFRPADGLDILLVDDDDFWQRIGCHRGLLKLTGSLVQPKDVAPELARDLPGRIGLDHDSDVLQTIGEPRGYLVQRSRDKTFKLRSAHGDPSTQPPALGRLRAAWSDSGGSFPRYAAPAHPSLRHPDESP